MGFARNAAPEFANRQLTSENIHFLSETVNYRISREIDGLMESGSTQVIRAVIEAINGQILPQIQNMIKELWKSTQVPSKSELPEPRPEEQIPVNPVSCFKNDLSNREMHRDSHYSVLSNAC